MRLLPRVEADHGTDLLQEFVELIDAHRDRAESRIPVIKGRLAALEAEEADLRQLLRRLEAADRA